MLPRLMVDLGRAVCLDEIISGLDSSTTSDSFVAGASNSGSGCVAFSFVGLSSIFFLTLPGKVQLHYLLKQSEHAPSS